MSPAAFATIPGPAIGSAAPARSGVDARSTEKASAFGTALEEAAVEAAPAQPTPPSLRSPRSGDTVEPEAAGTEPREEPTAELTVAVEVPLPVAASAPPQSLLTISSSMPDADPVVGEAAVAAPLLAKEDVAVPPTVNPPSPPETEPAAPVSAAPVASPAKGGAKADETEGGEPKAPGWDRKAAPMPAEGSDENTEIPQAKIVTPPASDRAREVAAANSAVITGLRPARVAQGSEPLAPSAGEAPDAPASPPESSASEPETTPPVPLVEPGRVRDVIDRATARASAPPSASGADSASPSVTSDGAKSEPAASPPGRAAITPPEPAQAVATTPTSQILALEEPAASTATAAPPSAPEGRPTDPVDTAGLSTFSRVATETTAQIAAQIVRRLEGRSTRFEMALTPEDLGRVDVSLDIDADGGLVATLAFDNPAAATELRGRADELRRQLLEAGFTLADDALSFSERDPSSGHGGAFDRQSNPRGARAFGAASRLSIEADLAAQPSGWISLSLTPQGVDMKV